jgi:hypothetical protein
MPDITTCRHKPGKPYSRYINKEHVIQSKDYPDFSFVLWVNTHPVIYYKGERLSSAHGIDPKATCPWPLDEGDNLTRSQSTKRYAALRTAELFVHWLATGSEERSVMAERVRLKKLLNNP